MHTALDNSLNRGNKPEIVNWAMPDWSKAQTITLPYTTPCNGWIVRNVIAPAYIHLNIGTTGIKSYAGTGTNNSSVYLPTKKGIEYTKDASAGTWTIYFVPCIGEEYTTPPASGYTMNGTVYVTDGVASNFSWQNYLKPDYSFAPAGKSFEINCSIKVNSMSPDSQYFFGSNEYDTDPLGFNIGFESGHPMFQVSTDGSSFGSSNVISDFTVSENTKYYFKLTYDGNGNYTFGISTDKTNWTTINVSDSTIGDNTSINIGAAYHRDNNQYLRGEMDLNDMSLSVDGSVVWTPL